MDTAVKTKRAIVQKKNCVACGACVKACPKDALGVRHGTFAESDENVCAGCGLCVKSCPANAILCGNTQSKPRRWYEFLWIGEAIYITLGFFNILFAWLGLIFMMTPLMMAIIGGNKSYCAKYCGKGQLFELLGGRLGASLTFNPPKFLRSAWFRYGFLTFFMTMFGLMIYSVVRVFTGAELSETVTLLWTFQVPWHWTDISLVPDWIARFAFGFYGMMLTSTVLGVAGMFFFKPRTFCVFCPMGTMTQGICKLKNRGKS